MCRVRAAAPTDPSAQAKVAGESAGAPGEKTKALNRALGQYLCMVAFAALLLEGSEVACSTKHENMGAGDHQTAVLDTLDRALTALVLD